MKTLRAAALLIAAASPILLRAQEQPMQDPGAPERGVARLSIVNGEVSVRRGDSGDWVAAAINAPLMVEDRLATGPGAKAEVQFDSANLIRVGANAEIRLAQVDYGRVNLQIAHGTVTFRVLRDSRSQVELDTPTVSVRPKQIGAYRVFVQEDGQTEITVRLGQADIYTPRGSEPLQAGQTMLARGNPADPEFQVVAAIARDQWDQWNEERDREMLGSASYRNVPQDVYGTEDLDNSGRWVDVPSYGEVWSPAVGPDWAPYQNGRWAWEDYYGWTWVSSDPWGWAPFHYGRWFWSAPNGWCWYPGGYGVHYWSPALVAFFGFGPGVGVGFGFGNIGWVALAPFEPLYAWWGRGFYGGFRSTAFFNRGINVTNVNITNVYRNARVGNGVVGVNAADFREGRFNNLARVSPTAFREAGLMHGQLPVAPSAASLRYSGRSATYIPRNSSNNVRFFSHNAPAAVNRVGFAEQQRAMQQYSRQPVTASTRSVAPGAGSWRGASSPAANNSMAPRATGPSTGATGSGAWRPAGPPASTATPDRGGSGGSSGWQRFGEPRATAPESRSNGTGSTTPRTEYSQPANGGGYRPSSGPATSNGSRPQSIRVAPSVVREKSTTKSDSGHATHGSGTGSHSGAHK
ncbi:MAG: DUF6600 domain-containing protein [Bryobacteraceae bacterium]